MSNVTMDTVSTPDATQSEAFVSTAALFLLFASSPKEEKVYLRLPAIWRDLWTEFSEIKKEQEDRIDRESFRKVRDLVRSAPEEHEDDVVLVKNFKRRNPERANSENSGTMTPEVGLPPQELKAIWDRKSTSPAYQGMLNGRMQLPIWNFKDQILESVERHQAVILCGETGCGKSTQLPAYIIEHWLSLGKQCKVYVTEPRRISAISLARRVSEEMGERKSDIGTPRSIVGYSIRLESKITSQTRLVYA